MPDFLYKLQPDRTMYLRGFNQLGAGAAMHNATPDSFDVTGVFRDPSDFAVLVIWDADDFFNHPTLKHLPDMNFSGLELQFDVTYTNLMPLNCGKYWTIDWPFLDAQFADGSSTRIRLSDPKYATVLKNPDPPASGSIDIVGENPQPWDRVTLWYQNVAFDYQVQGSASWTVPLYVSTPGKSYAVTVDERAYSYALQPGDSAENMRQGVIAAINASGGDPEVVASAGANPGEVVITARPGCTGPINVTATDFGSHTLAYATAATVAQALADQINALDYRALNLPFGLRATVTGATLSVTTTKGGYDANFIRLLAVSQTDTLKTSAPELVLSGGDSTATLRIKLNFLSEGLATVKKLWLTFAPRLTAGGDLPMQEWNAKFENWTVSGPDDVRMLQVAGPGSYWYGATDPACQFAGQWALTDGYYLGGLGQLGQKDSTVTIRYSSAYRHDLYLATEVNPSGGKVEATLDGISGEGVTTEGAGGPVLIRRRMFQNVEPGDHTVVLLVASGMMVFDHLLAAVPVCDTPTLAPQTDLGAALDYSTDHTYKLPPARILWMLKKLGLAGPVNQYLGVFWWNQRRCAGNGPGHAEVAFSGTFVAGDQIFLNIGDQTCGKSVFAADTAETVVRHFVNFINSIYVGIRAEADGTTLRLYNRSAAKAYSYSLTGSVEPSLGGGSTGAIAITSSLKMGQFGVWTVDPLEYPPLNAGARAWHTDFYQLCEQAGLEVTTAVSMELVNPPDGFAAQYADGEAVITDVGFANLRSTHCAFSSAMRTYQANVLAWLARAMSTAGLQPSLQCGEFTWWYFAKPADPLDLPFYATGNGTRHFLQVSETVYTHIENSPTGESSAQIAKALIAAVNAAPDPYVSASSGLAPWEVRLTALRPGPQPIPIAFDGGISSLTFPGGMAYYDAETASAAQSALRRPLAQFISPDDDPSVDGGADAQFLRSRLRNYCETLAAAVRQTVPGTLFEILFPDDVNYPSPAGVHRLGGRLNRFVNLPDEWRQPGSSCFDRFKVEALDFGSWSRDLELVKECQRLPLDLGWPVAQASCMTPVFRASYPWMKELVNARELGLRAVALWAFDHVNLFGLELAAKGAKRGLILR